MLFLALILAVLATLSPVAAEAGIIGQKRFLPLNQAAQKQRQATIIPLSEQPARTQASPHTNTRLARQKFIPIRRDVMTIRRSMGQTMPIAQAHRAPSQRAQNTQAPEALPKPQKMAATLSSENKDEAIIELFDGKQAIKASHPFLK